MFFEPKAPRGARYLYLLGSFAIIALQVLYTGAL
jgi:hypothetical protein